MESADRGLASGPRRSPAGPAAPPPGQLPLAWFYVCIGCVAVFVPFTVTMAGYWSPARARAAFAAHEAEMAGELRRLHTGAAGNAA